MFYSQDSLTFLLLVFFLVMVWLIGSVQTTGRINTFICLDVTQGDYCLGISPGSREPWFNPADLFQLQVKPRERNLLKRVDHKKMRWDVLESGHIRMTNYSDLYMGRKGEDQKAFLLGEGCPQVKWESFPPPPPEESGKLQLKNSTLCLTVVRCAQGKNEWCDKGAREAIMFREQVVGGNYVRFKECLGEYNPAQLFRMDLTCQLNNCSSLAPTSLSPSYSPSQPPSLKPSSSPTIRPTTLVPTTSSSNTPTKQPTLGLIDHEHEEEEGLDARLILLIIIIILVVIIYCLFCFLVVFAREEEEEEEEKKKEQTIVVMGENPTSPAPSLSSSSPSSSAASSIWNGTSAFIIRNLKEEGPIVLLDDNDDEEEEKEGEEELEDDVEDLQFNKRFVLT